MARSAREVAHERVHREADEVAADGDAERAHGSQATQNTAHEVDLKDGVDKPVRAHRNADVVWVHPQATERDRGRPHEREERGMAHVDEVEEAAAHDGQQDGAD